MTLTLAIPCYRDADRLSRFLPDLARALAPHPGISIRVVDDGSGPTAAAATREATLAAAHDHPAILPPLLLPANLGKGGAIYAAWDAAPDADWLGFVDADGAVPAREVARLVSLLPFTPADALLASRVKMLGRLVERTPKRHLAGRVFATLTTLATGLAVYDSQCGCKFVRRSLYERVRPALVETRFAFDVDLLAHLHRAGARLEEVPIDWTDIPGSKVSLLRDSAQMAAALLKLRARLRG